MSGGPYWMHHTDGEHQIKGSNGKILFRYSRDQQAMADAHLRKLVLGDVANGKALRKAAPELLRELIKARDVINALYVGMAMSDEGRAVNLARFDAAIAKATGQ